MNEILESFVNELIKVYHIEYPIKNIENVIENMGGKIQYTDIYADDGSVQKNGNGFIINIYKERYHYVKKFSVAQAIWILFLKMGYQIDPKVWDESKDFFRLDDLALKRISEMNYFAGAFLMPEKLFQEKVDEFTEDNYVNTKEIADYFHVSVTQASNRGNDLGIFQKW